MIIIQFLSILLPIFSIFLIGYIVGKVAKIDIHSLSFLAINVLYPFLAFHTFYENEITTDYINIFIVLGIVTGFVYVLIIVLANMLKYSQKRKHAMLLAGVFMNGGNYGVPVALFALGEEGFMYALMIMVVMSILMNSLGLYIAASGANEYTPKKESLMKVLKMPILISVIIGIIFQAFSIKIPYQIEETIVFLADAAIPIIMITLGIQLSTIIFKRIPIKPVGAIVFIRLVLSPIITLGLVHAIGINGTVLGTVLVIIAAMPTAANTTMFSVQYGVEPDFVSSTTFISTVLSLITLPIWFYFL
ncbi:AEC family transporter [Evansella halocellulosilytica]|uniref:AEC family transporter n=1 Tax=Evansella halocellulosilytica TaxID=2011013 RepID=UPI000BB7F255|nr:AEC family transporter [Evansella halocellulosilytica]